MLSHVHIGITNFEPAFAFYRGVMDELGFTLKFSEPEKSWAGWMQAGVDRPLFLIGYPYNGERAAPGNGQMVALLAPTPRCCGPVLRQSHRQWRTKRRRTRSEAALSS